MQIGSIRILLGSLLSVMLGTTSCVNGPVNNSSPIVTETTITPLTVALNNTLRKLLEDQAFYTRNYIISSLAELKDVPAVKKRLLKNQEEMARSLRSYYGETAKHKLTKLLKHHIAIAEELITWRMKKRGGKSKKVFDKWRENGDEIATFLSDLNPHWEKKILQNMFYKYISLTETEIDNRLGKKWAEDIQIYDEVHKQSIRIADFLTEGVLKQFPDRFYYLR